MQLKRLLYSTALRLAKIEGDRPRSSQVFGMSEAGECSRVIYLRRLKPEERTYKSKMDQARVMMLLNDGRYHQAAITDYIKQTPGVKITNIEQAYVITRTIKVGEPASNHTYVIVGHPDGILTFVKEKKRLVLEIKGLSRFTKGMTKLEDHNIETFRETYPKAIPQARMYSVAADTDGALIVIKNKDNSELHECFLPRDKAAEDRILDKFDRVAEKLVWANSGEVPCDYIAGDKNCAFCPFSGECGFGK